MVLFGLVFSKLQGWGGYSETPLPQCQDWGDSNALSTIPKGGIKAPKNGQSIMAAEHRASLLTSVWTDMRVTGTQGV